MPAERLSPGERVLVVIRRHSLVLLVPLAFAATSAVLILSGTCPVALTLRLNGRCPAWVASFFVVAAAVFLVDWFTTRLVLTTERLLLMRTPLWLRTHELRLSAIDSLTLRTGLLGRFFGYGDVTADSAATRAGRLRFDFAPQPEAVQDRIAAAVAARREA